jgi:hypothetical protein
MAITTVVPDATVSGASLYQINGGSGTVNAALSDSSDTTYIIKQNAVLGQADAILDFGTLSLTSSQTIKQVRLRARCSTPTTSGKINVYLGARLSNQNYFFSGLAITGQYSSATTFTGPYYNSAPDGTSWTQTAINNLRAKVSEYKDTTDRGKIYELYIDVDVATKPTLTIQAPSGSITSTTTPDVSWTFADTTDNGTQAYYQVKVFTANQYSASGFNPTTSTGVYDSGQVASSDQNAVVGSLLTSGSYRCYIRVAKDINGSPFWSDWAFSGFSESYSAPTAPTQLVAWSASLGYATFTLTGGSSYSIYFYQVERSDDSGVTWDYIRDGEKITLNASNQSVIADYEAPRGITAYYRCRAVAVDSNSIEYPSGWSVTQQVLITNDSSWWFKCIEDPTLNKGSIRVLKELDVQVDEPNTVFRPLGATKPIIVAGPLQGEDGAYNIKTVTETEWDAIYPLIVHQGKLLVQDPFGNQKWIRITDRKWTAESQSDNVYRDITLTYVEIAEIVFSGFKRFNDIEAGPYISSLAINRLEGARFRLGFRTNANFDKNWILRGNVGFGTRDLVLKYSGEVNYLFSKKKWTMAGLRHSYDIERVGLTPELIGDNKLFYAFTRWGAFSGAFYRRETEAFFTTEPTKGISFSVSANSRSFDPLFRFQYRLNPEMGVNSPVQDYYQE